MASSSARISGSCPPPKLWFFEAILIQAARGRVRSREVDATRGPHVAVVGGLNDGQAHRA
jgi:hypothetical protein